MTQNAAAHTPVGMHLSVITVLSSHSYGVLVASVLHTQDGTNSFLSAGTFTCSLMGVSVIELLVDTC